MLSNAKPRAAEKNLKTTIITVLLMLAMVSGVGAQCKYEYKEKDIITNELNFVTERFMVANRAEKKKDYAVKSLRARFEKKGDKGSILIVYALTNSFGKFIAYTNGVDSMVIRFANGNIRTTKINKMVSINNTGYSISIDLSYELNEELINEFKGGSKVTALRISGATYTIDIAEFETDITKKFNECWVD